jgi:GNAT superfamily N-acetyltransferase
MPVSELKHLWSACFHDSIPYINQFFSQRYKPENTLVHRENGRAVAMLTLLPVTVVTPRGTLPARYVYAVGTLPEYRGRGISSALARQADSYMQAEGCALALVVPATDSLFAFYAQQGFSTAFYRRRVTWPVAEIGGEATAAVSPLRDIPRFYALREQHFGHSGFFVRWDEDALRYALHECRLSGGDIYRFSGAGTEGYIVAEPEGATVCLKEIALAPELATAALAFLKKQYAGSTRFECRLMPHSALWPTMGVPEPVAMLKWFIPPPAISLQNAYISLLKD